MWYGLICFVNIFGSLLLLLIHFSKGIFYTCKCVVISFPINNTLWKKRFKIIQEHENQPDILWQHFTQNKNRLQLQNMIKHDLARVRSQSWFHWNIDKNPRNYILHALTAYHPNISLLIPKCIHAIRLRICRRTKYGPFPFRFAGAAAQRQMWLVRRKAKTHTTRRVDGYKCDGQARQRAWGVTTRHDAMYVCLSVALT